MLTRARSRRSTPIFLAVVLCCAGCSKTAPNKDQILSRANEHFAANEYAKAEADYRSVLRLDQANRVAVRQLGFIYFDQGEMPQAYAALRRAADLEPDNLDVKTKLGTTELWARQFKDARDVAVAILDKKPGSDEALQMLVETSIPLGDSDDVETLIHSYREKDIDRPGYHLAQGELARIRKDQSQAESEFKAALALDPKSIATYLALGNLYWSRNDLGQAGEAFKQAADLAPLRSPAHIAYADFKRRSGATEEAKALFEEISRDLPDALPPRVNLMKIACAQRQPDCAKLIRSTLAADPLNYDGLFESGVQSLANNEGAQAVRTYEQLARIYVGAPIVRYQLALAYLLNGRADAVDKAIANLNTALGQDPRLERATLLLAQLKIGKGQYVAAIDLLNQLVAASPHLERAQLLLASAYVGQRDQDQALEIYRRMIDRFPEDPEPAYLASALLFDQRKFAESRQLIERSLQISPDYPPAVEKRVDLDIAEQQYNSALDVIQKQIQKRPDLAQFYGIRAKIYIARKDFSHAETDLQRAIDLDPKFERAYILLAELYLGSGRQERAIERLNAFVQKNKDIPSLMLLAAIHEQQKQFDAAAEAYKKVLAINPNYFTALNNLAYLDAEYLGQLDSAFDLAKRAKAVAPDEPNSADTLGWVQFRRGDYDGALPLLQTSAGRLPNNPLIQYHLGMDCYMKGEETCARAALQKAVAARTDFPGKSEAAKRLAVLSIDVQTASADTRSTLESLLNDNPKDSAALIRLAELQQREGELNEAAKNYQRVLDTNPRSALALKQLALLEFQRLPGEKNTYDLVARAHLANPDDAELTKTLGILSYRRAAYPRALELFQLAAAKFTQDAELQFYLGMTHYELKQFDDTKQELDRALQMQLAPDNAAEAKRALADCCESAD